MAENENWVVLERTDKDEDYVLAVRRQFATRQEAMDWARDNIPPDFQLFSLAVYGAVSHWTVLMAEDARQLIKESLP